MKLHTRLLIAVCLLVFLVPSSALALTGDWGIVLEGVGSQVWVRAVTTDGNDEIYVAGEFKGTLSVAGGPALVSTSPAIRDVFVAKLKQNGTHLWSLSAGGSAEDFVTDIDANASGDVAVVGFSASDTVDFGGGLLFNEGLDDAFVASFDLNGVPQWSRMLGGINNDRANSVAVESGGEVIVAGSYEGKVDFGTGSFIAAGLKDWFLVRIDAGVTTVAESYGGTSSDFSPVIALDPLDRIALAGRFQGTVNLGNGNLVSAGGQDVAVAYLTAVGAVPDWSTSAGGTGTDLAGGIAVDAAGVYLTGAYTGTLNIGGGSLVSAGGNDGFVASWKKAGGAFLWAESFGGPGSDFGNRVALDGTQLYVAATFEGLADFGPFQFFAQALLDAALLELDTAGNWDAMLPGRGGSIEFGSDVAMFHHPGGGGGHEYEPDLGGPPAQRRRRGRGLRGEDEQRHRERRRPGDPGGAGAAARGAPQPGDG